MNEFYWIAVAAVSVLSAARLTRLAIYDKFPPVKWFRDKYIDIFDGTGWAWLAFCPFCMSPWMTALVVLWGWAADFNEPWWLFNSIMAGSYLAATYMLHDGDGGAA